MEEEEPGAEHAEGDGAQGEDQIAPAHVLLFGAVVISSTAEGGDISPGKETANQLTDGPPDTQHGQEVARGTGQEFQEGGAINGQVTANTKTQAGEQSTSTRQNVRKALQYPRDRKNIPDPVGATT